MALEAVPNSEYYVTMELTDTEDTHWHQACKALPLFSLSIQGRTADCKDEAIRCCNKGSIVCQKSLMTVLARQDTLGAAKTHAGKIMTCTDQYIHSK